MLRDPITRFGVALAALAAFLFAGGAAAGTWTPLQNKYPGVNPELPILLTDGTVMVHETCTADWYKLRPDASGDYAKGTWSAIASFGAAYEPFYTASQVLADGRVIVNGGEYNHCRTDETNMGALYDPVADTWTKVDPPAGWATIGATASIVRRDKTYQLANCCTQDLALAHIDGNSVTWTILTQAQTGKNDDNLGAVWTTLPDQTVLTVDTTHCAQDATSCTELFDPASNTWSDGARTCGQLVQAGLPPHAGPMVLLPNGFVFAAGATTTNCVLDTATGQWHDAPSFGGDLAAWVSPAAVLPNGKLLIQASKPFHRPSHFFEVDVKSASDVTLSEVAAPASAAQIGSYGGRLLPLPTGQVLWVNDAGDVELYASPGKPKKAWRPKIGKVAATLAAGSADNRISGKDFNGFTFGGYYAGGEELATNYPLVRITNTASGHVCYARTHDHNRMGLSDGGKSSTLFDIPATCEGGSSTLEVIANGIASKPVAVTLQ